MATKKFTLAYLLMLLVLLAMLVFPVSVLADDGAPPQEEPSTEEVTEGSDTTQVGESADGSSTEPAVIEDTVIESAASDSVDETGAKAPLEDGPSMEETVVEVVEILAETDSVLLDESGEAIPLASEEAAEILTSNDPWFDVAPGVVVGYSSTGICAPGVTECNTSGTPIQAAINDARSTGKIINIEAGSYYENVQVIRSVTLKGAGEGLTFLYPANSDPDTACGGSCESSAATNTVIWVRADNVSIYDLTVNGNNPFLTSGVLVGGEDIDAHNGILTNTNTNLTVQDVTVENIYQRGIQVGKNGANFNISDNTVDNVQGSYQSIAIFNYTAGGTIANNTISNVGDGIASNWSIGTQVYGNTITNASSGIHTDNMQVTDSIWGNTISNGGSNSYGIFVFAPYAPVTVDENTVMNVDYGLTLSGNGWGDSLNTIAFDQNNVTSNVAGAYMTTDVWGYFTSDVSATFNNNIFSGGQYGFYLESQGDGDALPGYYSDGCGDDCVLSLTAFDNSVSGQSLASVYYATGQVPWYGVTPDYNGVYEVDASGNWWGDNTAAGVASMMVSGVDYSPWLDTGTDTSPGTFGFQGDFSSLHVDDDSGQTGTTGYIQEGVDLASGSTVYVHSGTYTEQVDVDHSVDLIGDGALTTTIQAPAPLVGLYDASTAMLYFTGPSTNASFTGFTVDGDGALFNAYVRDGAFADIHDNIFTGGYVSIEVGRGSKGQSGTAWIEHNDISGYGKNGITVDNTGSNATVTNNWIYGTGPTAGEAQNGVQISRGATGSVTLNEIYDNYWTGTYGGSNDPWFDPEADGASGILLYGSTGTTEIANNDLFGNQFGIWTVAAQGVDIHDNEISSGVYAGDAYPTGIAIWDSDQWIGYMGVSPVGTTGSIHDNLIYDNMYGIHLKDYTLGGAFPYISVDGNELAANFIALGVQDSLADVTGNTFDSNLAGMYVWSTTAGTANAVVTGNAFTWNGYGVITDNPNTPIHNNSFTLNDDAVNYDNAWGPDFGWQPVDATNNWWGDASGPMDNSSVPDLCNLLLDNPGGLGDHVDQCVLYTPWLTTWPPPPPPPPADGGGGTNPPQVDLMAGFIPVTSGQAFEISCDTDPMIVQLEGIQVSLSGLCGYSVILDLVPEDGLPGDLPADASYAAGLSIALLKDGSPVSELPEGASFSIGFNVASGFAGKQLAALDWIDGEWVSMDPAPSINNGMAFVSMSTPGTCILVGY